MARVITQASMSLDGFIADHSDQVGALFDWYSNGDVEVTGADPDRVFRVSAASAEYLRSAWSTVRATVIGRRLFDITNGWDGRPPVGEAVFVVTHRPPDEWDFPDAPFTFVTGGPAEAVALAKQYAGDGDVAVTPGDVGGQAFAAGLVDEVLVDLVPVVFGAGVHYFGGYHGSPLVLEDPEIVQGDRVCHLRFRVRRD
ncbi:MULTISPECIES: dihydrofolate reductase family protein [Kitasatospora]|uniref:Dihydrofolate reductase family protein n=1 Tax=Kitasatospora arboriphila TaxID=258052 RepID=A0ABN1TFD8_9ACTN